MSTSRVLLSVTASLALATFVSASDEPTLEQRLEKLAKSLDTAREPAHIPGSSTTSSTPERSGGAGSPPAASGRSRALFSAGTSDSR